MAIFTTPGSGLEQAGDRLSDYFIRRADQYSPVIQVSPQAVDIIFIKQSISLSTDLDLDQASESYNETIQANAHALLQAELTQAQQLFNSTESITP